MSQVLPDVLDYNVIMDKAVSDKIKQDLINTGVFLESDTYQLFKNWKNQRVFDTYREHSYSYSKGSANVDGTIDVLAETGIQDNNMVLFLPIECKKADPRLKHWVFEPHRPTTPKQQELIMSVKNGNCFYNRWYNFPGLGYNAYSDYENCVNVFEFNETDGRLSRQGQKELRAYYAIKQANESVPGVVDKIPALSRNSSYHNVIVPIVVTTANLWVTDYDPAEISKENGDIPIDKLELKPKNWVIYSYPVPFHESISGTLQDNKGDEGSITPDKRLTFIVKSTSLKEFVESLIGDLRDYFNPPDGE
jgi:hypothetical protein